MQKEEDKEKEKKRWETGKGKAADQKHHRKRNQNFLLEGEIKKVQKKTFPFA